ncbi:MAG: S-layer homology domain-containing protein [Bryobacterales bacterium]|nr:S-layer homology domain-containing protein [Bryobacterales bacterium]
MPLIGTAEREITHIRNYGDISMLLKIGPAQRFMLLAVVLLTLLTPIAAVGQDVFTMGSAGAGQTCIGAQPPWDPWSDSYNPNEKFDTNGKRVRPHVQVGPSRCPVYILGATFAKAYGDVAIKKISLRARAIVDGSRIGSGTGAGSNVRGQFRNTLKNLYPLRGSNTTIEILFRQTYAIDISGLSDGLGAVYIRLQIERINGVPPVPSISTEVFKEANGEYVGVLEIPKIRFEGCRLDRPCTLTYSVLVGATANLERPDIAVASAKVPEMDRPALVFLGEKGSDEQLSAVTGTSDPVRFELPGWHYTLASDETCADQLDKESASMPGGGDSESVTLNIAAGCAWTASSNSNWLRITSGVSGTGRATIRYSADPNHTGAARSGILTIAGSEFVVNQASGACSVRLSSQNKSVTAQGGSDSVSVVTAAGCQWTPAESADWILAVPAADSGSGAARLLLMPNAGTLPRTGSFSIAGKVTQVLQASPNPVQVFQDIPLAHQFADYIWLMKEKGITSGCNSTQYCPDAQTTRGQMAVFIIRSLMGDTFTHRTEPYFTDVPSSHQFFRYIQKLRELGITTGCSTTAYCPNSEVTRGQMAAFIVRARLGITAGQPLSHETTPYFTDVPATDPFFSYVQKMKDLGITSGCGPTTYCTASPTTRGQMAVFLIRGLVTP